VYSALVALPWGGSELVAGAADGDDRLGPLFEDVEKYMGLRLRQRQPGLAPFSAPLDDEDIAARFALSVSLADLPLAACCSLQFAFAESDERRRSRLGKLNQLASLTVCGPASSSS